MATKKELWTASDVKCPFYISDSVEDCHIRCEGFSQGSSVINHYRSISLREKQMGSYCAGRYERCPMYKCVFEAKYND